MPVSKICQQCSIEFKVPNRRNELVKFCSRACKTESGYENKNCVACGVEFKRKKNQVNRSSLNYCSKECNRKSIKGRPHKVDPDAPKYFRTCESCSVEFQVTMTRKDTARFCSTACKFTSMKYRKELSEAFSGEKHWRWTGGRYKKSSGYVRVRTGDGAFPEHRHVIFKNLLRIEPNHPFIVTVDGIKKLDSEIEVHHIDRDRTNNSFDNLLAVTKPAHYKIHHWNKKPEPDECWPRYPEVW